MKTYVASHLKDMNRQLVYKVFLENREVYKSELSRITHISAPTVMKIANFLLEKELIVEVGEGDSIIGRKPDMLRINANRYYAIGVIYEGDYITLGLVNLVNEITHCIQVHCKNNFEAILLQNIEKLLSIAKVSKENILGIGIGVPGIYNPQKRELIAPLVYSNSPKYLGEIIDELSKKYGVNVFVDNDVNLESYGEYSILKPKNGDDHIHISVGTGVGAGIILGGKIRRGANDRAGEIGYFVFDYVANEENKTKSKPWIENKFNFHVLEQKFGISIEDIFEVNEKTKAAMEYVAVYLSMCINNIVMCYDIENVSVGGIVVEYFGTMLIDRVKDILEDICFTKPNVYIQEPMIGVIGAGSISLKGSIYKMLSE